MEITMKHLGGVIVLFVIGFAIYTSLNAGSQNKYNLPRNIYENPTLKTAYIYAINNPEILENFPCYCGCMEGLGHKSNKDCFFNNDGSLSDHASMCSGCVGLALDVKRLREEGKEFDEISKYLDEKYSQDY